MNIIYSWIGKPQKFFVQRAALSNFFSQRNGFDTYFIGNKESLSYFSKIKFTNFLPINDNLIQLFPHKLHSLSKLLSFTMIDKPFIHLDLDVVLTKPIRFNNDLDLIFLNQEPYLDNLVNKIQEKFNFSTELSKKYITNRAYNTSILVCNDIDFLKNQCRVILNYLRYNKDEINYFISTYKIDPSILIEKVWIYKHAKFLNKNCGLIVDEKNLENIKNNLLNLGIFNVLSLGKYNLNNFVDKYTKLYNIDY